MTIEDYIKQNQTPNITGRYSAEKFKCPDCGNPVVKDLRVVLATYPVQYTYTCTKCDYVTQLTF